MYVQAKITPDFGRSDRFADRRTEPRHYAETGIGLQKFGHGPIDARLVNISSRGFMAECDHPIERDMLLWLTIPGVPRLHARVIWSVGGRFGGEFANPIDPMLVLVAINKHKTT
jgi:hypothetical protein